MLSTKLLEVSNGLMVIVFADISTIFVKLMGFFSVGYFFGILIKSSAFAIGGMVILV
jgi:hypothetical protein